MLGNLNSLEDNLMKFLDTQIRDFSEDYMSRAIEKYTLKLRLEIDEIIEKVCLEINKSNVGQYVEIRAKATIIEYIKKNER
jgi:hypothetical protein